MASEFTRIESFAAVKLESMQIIREFPYNCAGGLKSCMLSDSNSQPFSYCERKLLVLLGFSYVSRSEITGSITNFNFQYYQLKIENRVQSSWV